jgi:hypothetical protein
MGRRASIRQHLRHLERLRDGLEVKRHAIRRGTLAYVASRSFLKKLQREAAEGHAPEPHFRARSRSRPISPCIER